MLHRFTVLFFCLIAVVLAGTQSMHAADHLDAPDLRQQGDGGSDINDVYAFQSPSNPANTVLVVTVNPFAGRVNPFGTVSDRTFDPTVEYQLQIDNNGDSVADVTYSTSFTAPVGGTQTLTTIRNGVSIASGSTGSDVAVTGGGFLHASLFDDPFFFDLVGFNSGFAFTGNDTFMGADVSAIVLEVPSVQLQNGGSPNIGVWARTLVGGTQIDRMGRPAINTALIPSSSKNAFNAGMPSTDFANFGALAQASILSLNGNDATHASTVAGILLPDVLTFDTSNSGGFLNGRRLSDDVIDAELNILSKGGVTTDMVSANDVPFRNQFPYLAAPHAVPEPHLTASWLCFMAAGLLRCRNRR